MNKIATSAIVLRRINYVEADKILTVITPDQGKVSLLARGVRKVKSKLAGGIELFSVCDITYIKGKKDISTLVSARLVTYFHHIVSDLDRTMVGYDVVKLLHAHTRDSCDSDYYRLCLRSLTYINNSEIPPAITKAWFMAQLLHLLGGFPNVEKTIDNKLFNRDYLYHYDTVESGFIAHNNGSYSFNHIKVLKLLRDETPQKLSVVRGIIPTLLLLTNLLEQQLAGNE